MWPYDLLLALSVPALALLGAPLVLTFERRCEPVGRELRWAASLALGLAYAQLGGMVLGWSGALVARAAMAWLGLGAVVACAWMWRLRATAARAAAGPGLRTAWPLLLLAPLALGLLLLAVVPPWYRDEMVYHLALPRLFASAGRITAPDESIFAFLPLGWESILALLASFGAPPDFFLPFNPRLVGAWTSVGAALGTMGLARLLGTTRRGAVLPGLLLLLVPTFVEFGSSAYVEPYLVLLSVLALAAALRVRRDVRFAVPAGLFTGLAASVKYPGLMVGAGLCLLLLLEAMRRPRPEERQALAVATLRFCLVAAVVGCPFYVRNLLEKGNPVFPLAWELFGGPGWDGWRAWALSLFLDQYGGGHAPVDLLLLPLRIFTTRAMEHGFEGSLGPTVGLGLLAGLAGLRMRGALLRRRVASTLVFVGAWSLFWAGTTQQLRFYMVAVPPLLALLAAGLGRATRARRLPPRLSAVGLLALSVVWAASPVGELWKRQHTRDWLMGATPREALLSTLLPASYPVYRELEGIVPPQSRVWLVWMRGYTYYLRRPYRLDSVFEGYRLEALLDEHASPAGAWQALRGAAEYLLVNEEFFLVDGNAELEPGRTDRLGRRFGALVRGGALLQVKRWGTVVLYRVGDTAPAAPAGAPQALGWD